MNRTLVWHAIYVFSFLAAAFAIFVAPLAKAQRILGEMYRQRGARVEFGGVSKPRVWVEAIFVETSEEVMRAADGLLEPPSEEVMRDVEGLLGLPSEEVMRDIEGLLEFLNKDFREKVILPPSHTWHLLSFIDNDGGAVVGLSSVVTRSGEEVESSPHGEIARGSMDAGGSENEQKRRVGPYLRVTPRILSDGRINMSLTTGMMVPSSGEAAQRGGVAPARFRKWAKTMTVTLSPGQSIVLKERRSQPFCRTKQAVFDGEGLEVPTVPYRENIWIIQEHRRRLARIIPEVKFEEAKLEEVVRFFSMEATEDNIVIHPSVFGPHRAPSGLPGEPATLPPGPVEPFPGEFIPPPPDPGITLHLKNAPAKVLLEAVLRHKNLRYFISFQAIIIVSQDYVPQGVKEQERVLLTIISAGLVEPKEDSAGML